MQDRERVLSALSHDMKNLVGAVDMNLQLIPLVLQSTPGSESETSGVPVGEFVERAHQAALGIGSLVDDVVAWFRMAESGVRAIDDGGGTPMTLGRLAALVRSEFSPAVKVQGLIFHLEMDGESSALIAGQAAPWRVLRLIMQHCLRFLFPNQLLTVKLSALEDGAFEFSVLTDQEAVFEGQGRSLAWLLAQDFATSSGGQLSIKKGASNEERVSVRWCDDSHAISPSANHSPFGLL